MVADTRSAAGPVGDGAPVIRERRPRHGGFRTRSLAVDGGGPDLLLLHGFSDTADTWRPLLRQLARHGQRASAVDLPGFGRADHLRPGAVLPQLDDFAGDLLSTRDAGVILVGNSLGAMAGLRAATDPALGVAGVVAISPAGFGHSRLLTWSEHGGIMTRALGLPLLPAWALSALVGATFPRLTCGDHARADREAVRAYARQFRVRADVTRMLAGGPALIREIRTAGEGCNYGDIGCPVLAVWGTRDRLTRIRGSRELLDTVPDSELVALPGFGHCPQLESPETVAELVLGFSARLAA